MTNITYLIGAGASANKIPCLKEFTEKLHSAVEFYRAEKDSIIDKVERSHNPHLFEVINKEYDSLINNLEVVLKEANEYSTIDTYAKYLYITSQYKKIGYLCLLIALGLLFFQKDGVDKRYDGFWTSILDTSPTPPENIKILSWNYDFQFEQSYLKFSKETSISTAQVILKVFPSHNYSLLSDYDSQGLSIVKLNGGLVSYDRNFRRFKTLVTNCIEFYDSIINILFRYVEWLPESANKRILNIGYAWDSISAESQDTSINIAKHTCSSTEVLIIIGYSFPFFNRKVDREILNSLVNLKTIYVQDLNPEKIISRLKSIIPDDFAKEIKIEPLKDTDQFFVPFDL